MISNMKHDGTHKTPEKCRPKATLSARIDETHPRTIKNARLTKTPFLQSRTQIISQAVPHTHLNLFIRHTHF